MSLIRLVENFTADINTFRKIIQKRILTENELKSLSDGVASKKLSESTNKYFESHPVATLEGKSVWKLPISRYDWKNENGRVYEKRLWQRVIEEQKESYQGNCGLADHPKDDDDGKFKETAVVWLNMGLDEDNKIVWGEAIFVGDNGRLAEEVMEAGGRVGFSSSGFGELEESDKSTVRWDSYQLERPADIVLNPSQKVYGKYDMKVPKSPDHVTHESTSALNEEELPTPENPKCTDCGCKMDIERAKTFSMCDDCWDKGHLKDKKETKKENAPMNSTEKLSKLEERKFRKDVGVFLEEADRIANPQEKLEELEEIRAYFSEGIASDLKEQVDKKIKETKDTIKLAIAEHGKLIETFDMKTTEELKEGIKKIAIDTQLYERDATEWKEIATGLQEKVQKLTAILNTRPTSEAYKTALTFTTRMKETFKKKETELLGVIKECENKAKAQKLIEQQMVKELASISEKNEKLVESNKALREYGLKVKNLLIEKRVEEQSEKQALTEAVAKSKEINIQPSKTHASMFKNFNENKDVVAYYNDLIRRHGSVMENYKDDILGAKTLREAMKLYVNILSELSAAKTHKVTEALEPEERQRIIESQTGVKIRSQSEFQSRLPQGWE
jgi:hypothetical protein